LQHRGRKNQFDVVPTTPDPPPSRTQRPEPAPDHLSPAMRAWWGSVLDEIALEPHRMHLLRLAAEAWDRCQGAREQLLRDGTTFVDKNGDPRAHPLIAVERDARIAFARLVRDLGLDEPIPRPPNEIGWVPPPRKPWA
jgi:P27 family predicted phage terminase small subunit